MNVSWVKAIKPNTIFQILRNFASFYLGFLNDEFSNYNDKEYIECKTLISKLEIDKRNFIIKYGNIILKDDLLALEFDPKNPDVIMQFFFGFSLRRYIDFNSGRN